MNRKDRRASAKAQPKPSVEDLFARAVDHHRTGQTKQAEALYTQALRLAPDHPSILCNLAAVMAGSGRQAEAVTFYERAIAADPALPEPRNNLGALLNQLGQTEAALPHLLRAVELRPGWADALCNLAAASGKAGRTDEAIKFAADAVASDPKLARAHYNLGTALAHAGRHAQANAAFTQALTLRPGWADALNGLGCGLLALGQPAPALQALDEAAGIAPDVAEIHNNRAKAFKDLDRLPEAETACRRALKIRPGYADALNCLGSVLDAQGRFDDALTAYGAAIDSAPDYAEAHANLAITLLRLGQWDLGWPQYEYRWQANKIPYPRHDVPVWTGAPGSQTLLLYAEQGFGDCLHFIRFAPLIKAKGLRVIAEVPAALVDLFRTMDGLDQVVAMGAPLPAFDLQLPMMSAPFVLGTTFVSDAPYLHSPSPGPWAERLTAHPGRKIGLVWAGSRALGLSAGGLTDRLRSVSVDLLAPLLAQPNCTFVSLQPGAPDTPPGVLDWTAELTDFSGTAALIAELDLVITVDTAVAHLAGALGKPVWVLARFAGCWRWGVEGDASPWYPSLRLFRQTQRGRWDDVVTRIRDALTLTA